MFNDSLDDAALRGAGLRPAAQLFSRAHDHDFPEYFNSCAGRRRAPLIENDNDSYYHKRRGESQPPQQKRKTTMKTRMAHRLAAFATAGMMASSSTEAFASSITFKTMTQNLITAVSGSNNLISTVCWIGGAGLGVAGIFKLKQHVDNPAQAPMKDGLIRLGAGGGLLAFPFIEQAMQGSVSNNQLTKIDASTLLMDTATAFDA